MVAESGPGEAGADLLPVVGTDEESRLVTPQSPRDLGIGGSECFRWLRSRCEEQACNCTPMFSPQHHPWQNMGD